MADEKLVVGQLMRFNYSLKHSYSDAYHNQLGKIIEVNFDSDLPYTVQFIATDKHHYLYPEEVVLDASPEAFLEWALAVMRG